MSITAEDVVRLFEEDPRARRRLAELLVSEPDIRLAIVSAALREVATKRDLEDLRGEFREDLRRLEERLARVEGKLDVLLKTFLAFSVPTLVAVIGVLLKMLLAP